MLTERSIHFHKKTKKAFRSLRDDNYFNLVFCLVSNFKMKNRERKDVFHEISPILQQHGYNVKQRIGKGTFGSCFLVESIRYHQDFVIKVLEFNNLEGGSCKLITFESELKALSTIIHPNIINIYDYFQHGEFIFMVLEYCERGSLLELLSQEEKPDFSYLIKLVRDVICALSFCHKNNIAHMDIKPSNILIDKFGNAKLADFGFSVQQTEDILEQTFKGSTAYMAPEILRHVPYNPFKADMWSLGITIYETFHGYLPFTTESISSLNQQILLGVIEISGDLDPGIKTIIRQCTRMEPSARPTPDELLQIIRPCESPQSHLVPLKNKALASHKNRNSTVTYPMKQIIWTKKSSMFPMRVHVRKNLTQISRIQNV